MPWVTGDLPGIGGSYKFCPEDFLVDEIPLYPACGRGEHLYLQLEKRGLTTHELLRQLAACFNLQLRDIGYAGLKDAQAVTRQWVSVPARCERLLPRLEQLPVKLLASTRHDNKLRLGHLAGNRFRLRVRQPQPHARQKADLILQRLEKQGVPNHFGEQRYGLLGNSHRLGQLLLNAEYTDFCHEYIGDPERIEHRDWREAAQHFRAGELEAALQRLPARMMNEKNLLTLLIQGRSARAAVLSLPNPLLRLYLSALQSWLFDQLLRQRLPELGRLQAGDLALKHVNGACFLVEDATREQARADLFEISPTAPLFGSKLKLAGQAPGERERELLTRIGLTPESWKLGDGLTMTGERRPLRVPISAFSTREIGPDLQLDFCLPRGSYATSVLHEIMKPERAEVLPLWPETAENC
ncbi:tRNA pseudouridine(13) synthase TruD [Geopsychrobacter electrodiphilus]|uniref:tRNA pseudouridine(13) synthase TruD n=1 Tax=Geopsychrobacter electrodiphilus TaxID=225196 RepID=UPI00037E523B|nr:tRNA pseudouridine(13) synthase TruD [Geopsychrobacter electrodiphilus]